jgi:threonylcarbamoyladenosine tRNA methylthiotransferase MtaB
MKVFFDLVGCRVNEAEIESMAAETIARGHEVAAAPGAADWIVVNTCTVTREAERDSRQKIRRAHARNPAARIAAAGCWATMDPGGAAALPGVAGVIPNAEKDRLISGILGPGESTFRKGPDAQEFFRRRTRAYIKAEDGCDNACAYCITRLARGPVRSRPADDVVEDILAVERSGAKEAVLAGVHLGAWGRDLGPDFGLERLIREILARTAIPRVRLSSLEPWDLRPEFFRLWRDGRLCPHLHLPLQSGCAETLRRMKRNASPEDFAAVADAARAAIPDLAVTSDLMVGFPGESEAEFGESLDFVQRMGFARLHVFRFSPRPGTEAARLPNAVPPQESRRRAEGARLAAAHGAESFARSFLGREMAVLWEADTRGGMRRGLTGNFLRVQMKSDTIEPNTITKIRLADFDCGGMIVREVQNLFTAMSQRSRRKIL